VTNIGSISEDLNKSLEILQASNKTKTTKRFSAISIETKNFKFDRESANER
jgi:hypothetical protein